MKSWENKQAKGFFLELFAKASALGETKSFLWTNKMFERNIRREIEKERVQGAYCPSDKDAPDEMKGRG